MSVIAEELLNKSISKIRIYQKEENLTFSKIHYLFKNINYNYLSVNTDKLDSLLFDMEQKFKVIKNIHVNDLYVLNHTIKKYVVIKQDVSRSFKNIGGGS